MIDLKKILSIQTYSDQEWRMFAYIVRECKALGADIRQDDIGNLYVTRGNSDTYPCIVAHMDSVHPIVEDLSIIEYHGMLTGFNKYSMKQTGIGGDDKVGIYIALRCLQSYDDIKVAFFVNEEQGCIGSAAADMTFFDDCRFVLQADRKGNKDFVVNASGVKLSSKKFKKAVAPILKSYGYAQSDGLMTDVMQLKENGLKVCCANVSCGYYRPHSADEFVVVADVERCLEMFMTIIDNMCEVYEHKYTSSYGSYNKFSMSSSKGFYRGYGKRSMRDFSDNDDWYGKDYGPAKSWQKDELDTAYYCDSCNDIHTMRTLTYSVTYEAYLCPRCVVEFADQH